MGNFQSADEKLLAKTLPTHIILKRMDECILPDEREVFLDYLEMLEIKLTIVEKKKHIFSKEFFENNGVPLLQKYMNQLIKDPSAVRLGINIIEVQTYNILVISSFIQYGGLDFLTKVIADHQKDEHLSIAAPKFLRTVLSLGATAAINEIKEEAISLQLCAKCQETMARMKSIGNSVGIQKRPKSSDRVNRVLMFMENYLKTKKVQLCGLDALVYFSKNADCQAQLPDTKLIEIVSKSLVEYKTDKDVVWRACLCLSSVADLDEEYALEIAQFNLHNVVAENFHLFETEFRVQQQILWFLNSLLKQMKSRRRVHMSPVCMELFKFLSEKRERLIREKAYSATERHLPFEIIAPVNIRSFLRETRGEVAVETAPEAIKRKVKKRRGFDSKYFLYPIITTNTRHLL